MIALLAIVVQAVIPTLPPAAQHVIWTLFALMFLYSGFNALTWVRGR